MLSFLKSKKTPEPFSLAFLHTDLHSHLLPGIDDGAPDIERSLQMVAAYVQIGIKKVIATPHARAAFFQNRPAGIEATRKTLAEAISTAFPEFELGASAEYFADEYLFEALENDVVLPIANKYILFEQSLRRDAGDLMLYVEKIQAKGYTPVLAHPERYRYWHDDLNKFRELKRVGVLFQLNLLSLTGFYGSTEKKLAERLLDYDSIDALGTDAHHVSQFDKLAELPKSPYWNVLQEIGILNKLI